MGGKHGWGATGTAGEFGHELVPESKTRGLKAFVGMYAGEHCAGTELMIGPLFVAERAVRLTSFLDCCLAQNKQGEIQ